MCKLENKIGIFRLWEEKCTLLEQWSLTRPHRSLQSLGLRGGAPVGTVGGTEKLHVAHLKLSLPQGFLKGHTRDTIVVLKNQ